MPGSLRVTSEDGPLPASNIQDFVLCGKLFSSYSIKTHQKSYPDPYFNSHLSEESPFIIANTVFSPPDKHYICTPLRALSTVGLVSWQLRPFLVP